MGLIQDDEIVRCKGCTSVLNQDERLVLVENIKWVDEVITGQKAKSLIIILRVFCPTHNICR